MAFGTYITIEGTNLMDEDEYLKKTALKTRLTGIVKNP